MNIFIIPSCIRANNSFISVEQRFKQTLVTLDSIRQVDKKAFIFFIDNSVLPLKNDELVQIKNKVDMFIDLHDDLEAQNINNLPNIHIVKGLGEVNMLYRSLEVLKGCFDFTKEKGRIFKMGGRCFFESSFDIERYEGYEGKYIFKTRKESWRGNGQYLIDTRMYSWCFSLVDEYMDILKKSMPFILQNIDTEHAHFLNIPQDKLVEFDKIYVGCIIALNGSYVSDQKMDCGLEAHSVIFGD